jgi:hypothetical protein
LRRAGGREGALGTDELEGAKGRIQRLDSGEQRFGQGDGRQLTIA